MFTNVDGRCGPQRQHKAMYLYKQQLTNKIEFILFTFFPMVSGHIPHPSFPCRTKERVNHHLPPMSNKR